MVSGSGVMNSSAAPVKLVNEQNISHSAAGQITCTYLKGTYCKLICILNFAFDTDGLGITLVMYNTCMINLW